MDVVGSERLGRNAPTPFCCQAALEPRRSDAAHSCASLIVARVSVETALSPWVLGAPDGIEDDQWNQRVVKSVGALQAKKNTGIRLVRT